MTVLYGLSQSLYLFPSDGIHRCLDIVYKLSILMCFDLGHALRKQTAGQFGPDLAKKLSQLVKMEKNVMRSMELVGRERMEVAVCSSVGRKRKNIR